VSWLSAAIPCHPLCRTGSVARRGQELLPGPETDSPVRFPGMAVREVLATRLEVSQSSSAIACTFGPATSDDVAPEPAGAAGDQDRWYDDASYVIRSGIGSPCHIDRVLRVISPE
jgi:hypothetical protein